jgi:hypothetical protein
MGSKAAMITAVSTPFDDRRFPGGGRGGMRKGVLYKSVFFFSLGGSRVGVESTSRVR